MKRKGKVIIGLLYLFLLAILLTGCDKDPQSTGQDGKLSTESIDAVADSPTDPREEKEPGLALPSFPSFAPYQEPRVDYTPAVAPYQVEPELANVINKDSFDSWLSLSAAAKKLLETNGFVVVPAEEKEFFMLYDINQYADIPSFITTDSMLHNYHLFFSHLLRTIEKEQLAPELKAITAAMLAISQKQYQALTDTAWENAAKRNMGFFAVAGQLLDPSLPVPQEIAKEVKKELSLITNHAGISSSPLINLGAEDRDLALVDAFLEDYSQYIPRGHYDLDEELQAYFKAMMWYGRMTLRQKSEDETKSAVLMNLALREGDNQEKWERIYEPTNFFVGKADDLSFPQYGELLYKVYGGAADLNMLVANEGKWQDFLTEMAQLEPPAINSIPIFDETIQPDKEAAIKGFRFMGQRYTLDGEIFQKLVYRAVKENDQGEKRMLPRALDIPAALGSQTALAILAEEGATQYAGYTDNMKELQAHLAGLDQAAWSQNLYWNWLYTLKALLPERGEGYPEFMRSQAWQRKDLQTFLGGWTELKHDTLLYAKQVYAEMGGGGVEVDDRGYVEPNPELYARLAALVAMTKEGLASRNLIGERDGDSLERMEKLALSLKTIAEKELSNIPLTGEEHDLIRSYGGQLEHFWLEALRDIGVDHRSAIYDNPAALIADVATDPVGWVLEEGTGYIFNIYVIVDVEGSLRIARGGVYSHYEFTRPLAERLTNKQWQAMLDAGQVPPLAAWTEAFISTWDESE